MQIQRLGWLIVGTFIAGCNRSSHPVAPSHQIYSSDVPSGWTLAQAADKSTSVGLPPHWTVYSEDRDTLVRRYVESESRNGRSEANVRVVDKAATNNEYKLLFQCTPRYRGADIPHGNVRVTPQPSAPTAQNEAKRIQALLSKRHVRLEEQDLTLAVGKTKRLRYELPFTTASRRVIRVHITYLCDHGASLCALTVIFPSDDRQSEAEADQMASTWRF